MPAVGLTGPEDGILLRAGDPKSFVSVGGVQGSGGGGAVVLSAQGPGLEFGGRAGEGPPQWVVGGKATLGGRSLHAQIGRDAARRGARIEWGGRVDPLRLRLGSDRADGKRRRHRIAATLRAPTGSVGELRIESGWAASFGAATGTGPTSRTGLEWRGRMPASRLAFRVAWSRVGRFSGRSTEELVLRASGRGGRGLDLAGEVDLSPRRAAGLEARWARGRSGGGLRASLAARRGRRLEAWAALPAARGRRARARILWTRGQSPRFEVEWGGAISGRRYP